MIKNTVGCEAEVEVMQSRGKIGVGRETEGAE